MDGEGESGSLKMRRDKFVRRMCEKRKRIISQSQDNMHAGPGAANDFILLMPSCFVGYDWHMVYRLQRKTR